MKRPNGYDEAQTMGEFTPVELGGHYAVVKQVSERQSSTGKDMIVVLFDFIAPDKQEGYFSRQFNNDDRQDKKWPRNGTQYIMVNDYNDPNKTSRAFKTFCTCAEKSNNMTIQWGGADWGKQFRGKKIGVVFGEVENEYNGRITMRHEARWFCSLDAVQTASIPNPKYLDGIGPATPKQANAPQTDNAGFMNIPDGVDEELPF